MQSRVVGQMESWRGRGRRAGRDALSRLTAGWRAGPGPGGVAPSASAKPGWGGDGVNGTGPSEKGREHGGSDLAAGGGPAGAFGAGRPRPEQDRAVPEQRPADREQRPAGRPEQARVSMP